MAIIHTFQITALDFTTLPTTRNWIYNVEGEIPGVVETVEWQVETWDTKTDETTYTTGIISFPTASIDVDSENFIPLSELTEQYIIDNWIKSGSFKFNESTVFLINPDNVQLDSLPTVADHFRERIAQITEERATAKLGPAKTDE